MSAAEQPGQKIASPRVREWLAEGALRTFGPRRIFVREQPGEGPLLLFLHGFPSSSFDWRRTLALLDGRAALAFDFLGFGLSEKPPAARYSLMEQAALAEAVVAARAGRRRVVVVAHDMGTSVATELMARDIEGRLRFDMAGVLLFNGNIIISLAALTPGQRLLRSPAGALAARLSSAPFFKREFGRLFSPSHPLTAEEAEDQWELWRRAGGHRIANRLVHYLGERTTFAERWHGAISRWPGRLELAWGLLDPVAPVRVFEGVRALRPEASAAELQGLGHYPQIEAPREIATLAARLADACG